MARQTRRGKRSGGRRQPAGRARSESPQGGATRFTPERGYRSRGPGHGGGGQGDLGHLELGKSKQRPKDVDSNVRTESFQRGPRSDEAISARREDPIRYDSQAYRQSQRFGGPSYGWNPDAVGASYDDSARAGEQSSSDDFGFGRDEAGPARDDDDFGSARERGEAERVAWVRPGSHNEDGDLREWQDRANELGNTRSFRRRR